MFFDFLFLGFSRSVVCYSGGEYGDVCFFNVFFYRGIHLCCGFYGDVVDSVWNLYFCRSRDEDDAVLVGGCGVGYSVSHLA